MHQIAVIVEVENNILCSLKIEHLDVRQPARPLEDVLPVHRHAGKDLGRDLFHIRVCKPRETAARKVKVTFG